MSRSLRKASLSVVTLAALLGVNACAHAQTVFSDTFDSGVSIGTACAYFSNASQNNGLVLRSENIYSNGGLGSDVSGSGFFLFEGTQSQNVPTA